MINSISYQCKNDRISRFKWSNCDKSKRRGNITQSDPLKIRLRLPATLVSDNRRRSSGSQARTPQIYI